MGTPHWDEHIYISPRWLSTFGVYGVLLLLRTSEIKGFERLGIGKVSVYVRFQAARPETLVVMLK